MVKHSCGINENLVLENLTVLSYLMFISFIVNSSLSFKTQLHNWYFFPEVNLRNQIMLFDDIVKYLQNIYFARNHSIIAK